MAITIIPLEEAPDKANIIFLVSLDGTTYQATLRYNDREDNWYMMLSDLDGNVIRATIKVVINVPLLRQIASADAPLGELIAIDDRRTLTYPAEDPELEDLGVNVLLAYVDEESLLEATS